MCVCDVIERLKGKKREREKTLSVRLQKKPQRVAEGRTQREAAAKGMKDRAERRRGGIQREGDIEKIYQE